LKPRGQALEGEIDRNKSTVTDETEAINIHNILRALFFFFLHHKLTMDPIVHNRHPRMMPSPLGTIPKRQPPAAVIQRQSVFIANNNAQTNIR
jgi:hypothetical protein